ncbi:hypothetical protein AVEN_197184-1 [Araneus ventricosus]|uniref:BTB domain-containing protein n=1 Tax=Araneus ventricosus TaxID=182803 RepID=A0A4Y2D0J4_ARAVE|nr:hypothetical protein AVEN_197184-1 [Araneus ventricosus]
MLIVATWRQSWRQNEFSRRTSNFQPISTGFMNFLEITSLPRHNKALYVNQCLIDMELYMKTKLFPAHKIVLCARSPIFKAMLTKDMGEKLHSLYDIGGDIVQQILLFLYSDTTENLQ